MFRTYQDRDGDIEKAEEDVKEARIGQSKSSGSSASSADALDAVERTPDQIEEPYEEPYEKTPPKASLELSRTASNVLERVASRITTRSIRNPPPPPDGGLKAWTQVAMAWLVLFTTWGYVNSFGSFQSYYTSTLPESPSTISWIGSIQVWLTFFIGAFSGRLLDAGLFIPTFIVGAVLQLLGIFLMSISTRYWHLMLTQGVLTGIGGGIFFCPAMGLLATYFSSHRGMAIGLATTGNSAGGMVYPAIVRELLPKLGFAWTARILGFVNLGCLAVVLSFMRPRLPPRAAGPVIDWRAFTEPVYVCWTAGLFFAMWCVYFTFYYVSSFGIDVVGLSYTNSTLLVVIINGVGFPARMIPPYFADKYGALNTVTPVLFATAIVSYTWLAVDSISGFYVFTVFYGFISAGFQCLLPTTVASLTPELNKVGTRLGMFFACISFAALTGPPIGGALQDANGGSYMAPQVWSAISMTVCACLVLTARVLKVGWKLKARC